MNNETNMLTAATQDGSLMWQETSDHFTFCATYQDTFYTITSKPSDFMEERAFLYRWDDDGNSNAISNAGKDIYSLFSLIMEKDEKLKKKYTDYSNQGKNENRSVSLYKIMKRLGYESDEERPHINVVATDSFYYADNKEGKIDKYIQPPMIQLPTTNGMVRYDEANVILISAPGATGKTAMSEYISLKLDIPIYNLGKDPGVGANSISGLLMRYVENDQIFVYQKGLMTGSNAMIIDGLDEAAIRITQDSFDSFLADVAFFAKGSVGLPFVILGRPAVMEDAAIVLEEKGIKTTLLQIEPFTISKAKDFIDRQVPSAPREKHREHYQDVRDYIIKEIGAFFKDESDMNHKVFERFIGYAPVLMSVKSLLADNQDFHHLLDELQQDKKKEDRPAYRCGKKNHDSRASQDSRRGVASVHNKQK